MRRARPPGHFATAAHCAALTVNQINQHGNSSLANQTHQEPVLGTALHSGAFKLLFRLLAVHGHRASPPCGLSRIILQ